MFVTTGIFLTEEEQQDATLIFTRINTAWQLVNMNDVQAANQETARGYFYGVCDALAESKFQEYLWRKEISHRYDIPYNFMYRDGEIFTDDGQGNSCENCN